MNGLRLLERCEAAARRHGFRAAELVATLPGERLYRACGYVSLGAREYPLTGDLTMTFVPMRKHWPECAPTLRVPAQREGDHGHG